MFHLWNLKKDIIYQNKTLYIPSCILSDFLRFGNSKTHTVWIQLNFVLTLELGLFYKEQNYLEKTLVSILCHQVLRRYFLFHPEQCGKTVEANIRKFNSSCQSLTATEESLTIITHVVLRIENFIKYPLVERCNHLITLYNMRLSPHYILYAFKTSNRIIIIINISTCSAFSFYVL